jgi:hypothetical protein
MTLEKFGTTLLLIFGILLLVLGAKMAIKVADPYTRKVSTSLADTLAGI